MTDVYTIGPIEGGGGLDSKLAHYNWSVFGTGNKQVSSLILDLSMAPFQQPTIYSRLSRSLTARGSSTSHKAGGPIRVLGLEAL